MTRPGGAFGADSRAAVIAAQLGKCAGCARAVTDVHHARPRGMGGTSNRDVGAPFNGVALCRRCHGLAESRRDRARLLGWITPTADPTVPYWTVTLGWCTWTMLDPGTTDAAWCVRPFLVSPGPAHDQAVEEHKEATK